ncbi:MAG: glycosyltransferase, partial [Pirellulaceae bacterium]
MLEAALHLRRHREDFCLVICGEGPMRAELESKIRDHHLEKQVRLLGFCEDPSRWIAAADLFVHPSRSEGLSLVTIAAQMLETPVLATDVGGLQEVMRCRWTSRP